MIGSSLSVFPMYRHVQHCALSFTYRGPFMDDFTSRIVDISENTIADSQGYSKINKKVSFLLVECFQNIIRHGENEGTENEPLKGGLFNFKNIGDSYIINSINLVRNREIDSLRDQVELINSLNSIELKEMYKRQLNENDLSDKGGAGLGLIEIARRSGQKLKYEFEKRDELVSHFHQQVTINRNGAEVAAPSFINQTKELFTLMGERQALIEYKGDFSQKSIVPLLTIVEKNFGKDSRGEAIGRKVGHILIEILQNISKHAVETNGMRDGLFIIGEQNEKIFILAGNIVANSEKAELERRLTEITQMNHEQLKEVHRKRIRESIAQMDKSSSGLGLIEIAKASSDKLEYEFDSMGNDQSFFSLHVQV